MVDSEVRPNRLPMASQPEKSVCLAYALWGLGFFGFCGLHRFYLGKPLTGLLWFFSGGVFFIGQIVDLFLIPVMVREGNRQVQRQLPMGSPFPIADVGQRVLEKLDRLDRQLQQAMFKSAKPASSPMHDLLEAASAHGKVLSFGQAVMATGLQPDQVEELLDRALRSGIAHVGNDPDSGAVRYYFDI